MRRLIYVGNTADSRIAYPLAGLSNHFDMDIYTVDYSQVRNGLTYTPYFCRESSWKVHDIKELYSGGVRRSYDLAIVSNGVWESSGSPWYEDFSGVLEVLSRLRRKSDLLAYIDTQEKFFFEFTGREFWDVVDYHFKHQLFRVDQGHLVRQDANQFIYHSNRFTIGYDYRHFPEQNRSFEWEKYSSKIKPWPFGPSVLDDERFLRWAVRGKRYDVTMSFRDNAVSRGRFLLAQALLNHPRIRKYSVHLGMKRRFVPAFRYRKCKYGIAAPGRIWGMVTLDYVLSLIRSKSCLGLGLYGPSLRVADCFKLGVPLMNWDMTYWNYGIPLKPGQNYISVGRREDILSRNTEVNGAQADEVAVIIDNTLSDRLLLRRLARNAEDVARVYFSSPRAFAERIVMQPMGIRP